MTSPPGPLSVDALDGQAQTDQQLRTLLDLERASRAEAETALARLRALQSVTEAALGYLDVNGLLRAVLERVTEILSADTAAVLLVASRGEALVARAAKGLEEEVESGVRIPIGYGFAGRIAAERRPIVIEDLAHADVVNPILRRKGVRSLMGVPLQVQGRVLGVMHVGTLSSRRFTRADVQFLEIVGDRVAMALEHARLYEAAREARRDAASAEEAVRLRDEFLGVAAHELKTPMTSVKAATQLLRRSFEENALTPVQRRAIDTIEAQTTKLGHLVVRLLDTVRLEGGVLRLERSDVDLTEMVRGIVRQIEATAPRHEFIVSVPDHLPARLDALRIEQVLVNLLDNAVKYSPRGGAIEVTLERTATTAVLGVRDHGIGVAAEHRPRLFDRFYQAHPDRSGMGLGLYITRQIVEMHGGTIYAEEPTDGGTRFVVSVPLGMDTRPAASR